MGADYAVGPLDESTKCWLREEGFAVPEARGRWPTPNEVRSALESFAGYTVTYATSTGGWDAEIVESERGHNGHMANVWVTEITDPDAPARINLHKPSLELSLRILEQLSRCCGPFLLMDCCSGHKVVVMPGADVPKLIAQLWD